MTDLAALYESDKGLHFASRHGYTKVYEEILGPLRQQKPRLRILEIGLRHDPFYTKVGCVSPSLKMWLDYFPDAEVVGFDINDFTGMSGGRVHVFQGDQGNPQDLARMTAAFPDGFDVIVEDGSHASYHQLVTLECLWPNLRPSGLFFIEDLHWQPEKLEASLPPTRLMQAQVVDATFLARFGLELPDVGLYSHDKLALLRKPSEEKRG
ncbi:class I SAM-dependent methyltransferase [Synechococcus sp. BA-132 BA5]|uniref:class I SAM-dependent methyltransferase n=1 Tax=Synechococcus sp. BA-132 BA5 TaxID=3110252 RepID=UPI002B1F09FF|nr:class I SAM-dependent methyltransferase [Synechococcus sp. BA-132 BA5]MEA5417279.1 class I SAM-dependent methyltransferase [Synechococcus sp. BA-132 BA5]